MIDTFIRMNYSFASPVDRAFFVERFEVLCEKVSKRIGKPVDFKKETPNFAERQVLTEVFLMAHTPSTVQRHNTVPRFPRQKW